jgi:hypothetical protein
MAVIIGMKQRAKTYQLLQEKNNNYSYINNELTSNLLYLNTEENAFNDAAINFKNNYQFGYINNKITVKTSSNLITVDNINIDLYKNTTLHSNLNVINYLFTSNNTNYFNNNIDLKLNTNQNSFKIKLNDNLPPIIDINNNRTFIRTDVTYTSNIIIENKGTLYTNFIDSPNKDPVVIRNMQFAESLRILSANVIQNISIDNDIVFSNLTDYHIPGVQNSLLNIPKNAKAWETYMINNNINKVDNYFTRPNINVIKYVDKDDYAIIGGSNILEFRTSKLSTSNIKKLVYSINNNGYMSIGEDKNIDIPLKINITPFHSNIIQYTNINNINSKFTLTSNGFINIGSINNTFNQLNILKNNNIDRNNIDLVSLNINNINYTTNSGLILIPFNITKDISNFIFIFSTIFNQNTNNINITITNPFIINNILPINNNVYDNNTYYTTTQYILNNGSENEFTDNIINTIRFPNIFKINEFIRINDTFKFQIYNALLTFAPIINDNNHYKLTQIYKLPSGKKIIYDFFIHNNTGYSYNYSYNGNYYPPKTNFITGSTNNNIKFSVSENGNTGIGINYNDMYNLYTLNALINDFNCFTINNPLTKNISLNYCSLNDINAINNATTISTDLLLSTSNFSSNCSNIHTIIESNLSILENNGTVKIKTKTILGGDDQYENYNLTILTTNYDGKGIVIKNDKINTNPILSIYSSALNSYPLLQLKNTVIEYTVSINNSNNFQLRNIKTGLSVIENNSSNNSISILNNSFIIFKDTNSNIKFYMGRSIKPDNWYDSIKDKGIDPNIPDTINMYGNLNFCLTDENPIINSYIGTGDKLKIGIGTINNSSDGLLINLSTTITSNLTAKKDILLEGTILSTSDSNLKTNIIKIKNPLNKINNINGYTYTRIDTLNNETGLLAQEVKEILPEVVKFENNHYNISYGNMSGLFVECIKELNKRIDDLEERIISIQRNNSS